MPGLIRMPMMFAQDWKLDEAIAKKVFKKYDKDKDGELNMAELKVVVENFQFIGGRDGAKVASGGGDSNAAPHSAGGEGHAPIPDDDIPF